MAVSENPPIKSSNTLSAERKSKRDWLYLEHKYFYNHAGTRESLLLMLDQFRNICLPRTLAKLNKEINEIDSGFIDFIFLKIRLEGYDWEDALRLYDKYIYNPFFFDLGNTNINKFELMLIFEKSRDRVLRKIQRRVQGMSRRPLYGVEQMIYDLEVELQRIKGEKGYAAFGKITKLIKNLAKKPCQPNKLESVLKKLKRWFLEYSYSQLAEGRRPASLKLEFFEIANCAAFSCADARNRKKITAKLIYEHIEKIATSIEKELLSKSTNDQIPVYG